MEKKTPLIVLLFIAFITGTPLYGADSAAYIISKSSRWKVYKTTNSKLPNNYITAMNLNEKNGDLWIGTQNGLVIARDTLKKVLHVADGLADEKVTCIFHDDVGWAWIGSTTKGITKYLEGQPPVYYSTTSNPSSARTNDNNITGIAQFNSTNFWIATVNGGLNQLQGSTMSYFTTANSPLTTNYITCIKINQATQTIWFGTAGKGLWRRLSNTYVSYDISNSEIPNNNVRCLYLDFADKKYLGTDMGLAILDGSGNWTVYKTFNSGLPSNRIYSVLKDLSENIWAGTDSGLAMYDGKNWHVFNTSNTGGGIPSNLITCLAQDDSGFIWVGTNQGLTKLMQRCLSIASRNNRLCENDTIEFELVKFHSMLATFQWQVNLGGGWTNISDGGVYSGALTKKLSINGVRADLDSALYRCVIKFSSLGYDTSNVDTLFVNPSPSKPSIYKLGQQLFTDPAFSYQWYFANGNIPIPGATTQGHTPWLTTYFYVVVTNEYGCKAKSDILFAEGNALDDEKLLLTLSPNPSTGIITASGNTGSKTIHSLKVIDETGKEIFTRNHLSWKGQFMETITLPLPEGIYYLIFMSNEGNITKQIIIRQ